MMEKVNAEIAARLEEVADILDTQLKVSCDETGTWLAQCVADV